MKKAVNNIKTKVTATFIAVMIGFTTVVSCTMPVMAASLDKKQVIKDITGIGVEQAINKTTGGGTISKILNKGAGYLLGMLWGQEESGPSIQDVLDKMDDMSKKIDGYHEEEMKQFQAINSNIDSKDFRMEADSIRDDYQAAIKKIKQYSNNITATGEGVIDETTYKTYKNILAESSCNISALEKNFNIMVDYVNGNRSSTNHESGYRVTTQYLTDKIFAEYKETKHDWNESLDYLEYRDMINDEIGIMESNVTLDYYTLMTLNDMSYKVRQYEVEHGIYKTSEGEDPYSFYVNFANDLTNSLSSINDTYKKIIDENNNNGDFVAATVEITSTNGSNNKKVKGFNTFEEAWAEANKDSAHASAYKITLYKDVIAESGNGLNKESLSEKEYAFIGHGGLSVWSDRNITIDLNGHTIDCSKNGMIVFLMCNNSNLTIMNGTIKGGTNMFHGQDHDNITISLSNVVLKDCGEAVMYFAKSDTHKINITMNNCKVEGGRQIYLGSKWTAFNATNSEFTKMTSPTYGGAIYQPHEGTGSTYLEITGCKFTNNTAKEGWGGAIFANAAIIKDSRFENNRAEDQSTGRGKGAGGAVACTAYRIYDSTFVGNSTDDQAGAVIGLNYAGYPDQMIERCTFSDNSSKNVGGAIRIFGLNTNNQYVKNCTFKNNSSGRDSDILVDPRTNGNMDLLKNSWGNTWSYQNR